jgi:hypothetical protein
MIPLYVVDIARQHAAHHRRRLVPPLTLIAGAVALVAMLAAIASVIR